ncbi:MAG TPA: hypothetical protein VK451_11900 [Methyloceanibacter sp.]|nr:hypothetical protein [Methyloceanibacter sp.]
MVRFSRSTLSALAAGALFALPVNAPARADNATTNLGPVGPRVPILVKMGDKRMIATYVPSGGNCFVSAVVFDAAPSGGGLASMRVRVSLHPGELFNVDGADDRQVVLLCGFKGDMLTVLNRTEVMTYGTSTVGE